MAGEITKLPVPFRAGAPVQCVGTQFGITLASC
jgi:hypothetical protein